MNQISRTARMIANTFYRFRFFIIAFLLIVLGVGIYFGLPVITAEKYQTLSDNKQASAQARHSTSQTTSTPSVVHQDTPKQVKAVYMSACAAGDGDFRTEFLQLLKETEINSVMIDVKDYTGTVSFPAGTTLQEANKQADGCRVNDMRSFIQTLHANNVYVIGRITAFQDPYYAKKNPSIGIKKTGTSKLWSDTEGLHYIDPGAKHAWKYLTNIGKAAYRIGFDELNFDYIRYPSDGNTDNMQFPISRQRQKRAVLKEFFAYLESSFAESKAVTSADIFGVTTTNADDLRIGQVLEDALAHFDYVAPMTYPSHYSPGFVGLSNPAERPYKVMHHSIQTAVQRIKDLRWQHSADGVSSTTAGQKASSTHATPTPPWSPGTDRADAIHALTHKQKKDISTDQLRPWIQDFDLGAEYTPRMVREQIQAVYDAGISSWMLWDPNNTYTRKALQPVATSSP